MTIEAMLDLETMGTTPNAPVIAIAIGIVQFSVVNEWVGPGKRWIIDLDSEMKLGAQPDASTILWWMQQSEEARAPYREKGMHVTEALREMSQWMDAVLPERNERCIWGNGVDFDNVVLAACWRRAYPGIMLPWSFRNNRCYRTVKMMNDHLGVKLVRVGTHHDALDDARSQAHHLIDILVKLEEVQK